ncbi:MAG: hypothetical protein GC137_08720 [Alphaproteobacteria bacterium]|nr:hypothetical protein [Alphaproteobacteria bacterium]
MSQDNQFHQYGYDHYLKAPARPTPQMSASGGRLDASPFFDRFKTPAIAAGALGSAAILFVGLIIFTYPSSDQTTIDVPIIKADLSPSGRAPDDPGGMYIPNMDSTVLDRVGQADRFEEVDVESPDVENLLSPRKTDFISKEEAIERAMAEEPEGLPEFEVIEEETRDIGAKVDEFDERFNRLNEKFEAARAEGESAIAETEELKEPTGEDILQKIGATATSDEETSDTHEDVLRVVKSQKPERPAGFGRQAYAPATSPETVEFVRNILSEDDETEALLQARNQRADRVAEERQQAYETEEVDSLSEIEPSIGAATTPAQAISSGTYFVQLASITDSARAETEWNNMRASYSVLGTSPYRVQQAALAHGTFYRIQAGPMSKEDARRICEALKAANKPGGCLVVQ